MFKFFDFAIDTISLIFKIIGNFIAGIIDLIVEVPQAVVYLLSFFAFIPPCIMAVCVASLTLTIALFIVHLGK